MKLRPIDIAELFAEIQAETLGPRGSALGISKTLCHSADAVYAFVMYDDAAMSGKLSLLAASGLDAAAYRRLEQRAGSTALMRALDQNEVIFLLVHD